MPDISALTDLTDKADWATSNTVTAAQLNTDATDRNSRVNELNDVVADLENNYSSATEPGDTPNGKLWDDTNTGFLKWRKAAAWYKLAALGIAQTWSAAQTFVEAIIDNLNINGNTISRITRQWPAPLTRAASTISRGRERRPARRARNTSGACCMPSNSMMP